MLRRPNGGDDVPVAVEPKLATCRSDDTWWAPSETAGNGSV